jgi:uncharacterized protein DUF5615
MLPLATDADVHGGVIRGLRRHVPDIDLVRAQEVGLRTAGDPAVLGWAAAEGRVLVTQDQNTMTGHAYDRVRAGLPMPGLLVIGGGVTIGQAINELVLVACCGLPQDFENRVQFLPL